VLILENAVDVTGSVKSILRSCSTLSPHFDFRFILPTNSRSIGLVRQRGFQAYEIPFLEIRRSWSLLLYVPALVRNLIRFRRMIKSTKASLVVSNDFYNMLPPFYLATGGKTPYICFVRFRPNRFPKSLVKLWCHFHYRYASSVIAVSKSVLNELKPHRKILMVYNELPIEEGFQYYDYDRNSKVILCLSNYIRGKGLDEVIQSFGKIHERFPDWKLRLVGGDMNMSKNANYKEELRNLAHALGINGQVEWAPFSNNVVEEYSRAAVVVNFSHSESFSLTCIEAMYVGRPVIATRSGGPQEIIEHGLDGELVDVGDLDAMAAALAKLLSDVNLRESYGKKAHHSVAQKFCLANTAFKLKPVYDDAISHANPGSLS
jgi:L-malate glycosyltransferase